MRKTKELSLEESVGQLQSEDFQQIKQALHSGPTHKMIGNKSSGSKPGLEKAHQNPEEEEQETAQVLFWGAGNSSSGLVCGFQKCKKESQSWLGVSGF